MSGHSKWATTKRAKEVTDSKRSSLFTKLAKAIGLAARDGGDPTMNFKLRMAIDRAKKFSLPKDNIERAIKSGAGGPGGQAMEEITYEGFGPDGIALIMEVITDNKNRAVSEIKHILSKNGGNLGSSGSVLWLFNHQGVIYLKQASLTDEQELQIIDAGAEDILTDDGIAIYTAATELNNVKQKLEQANFEIEDSGLEYIAKEKVKPKKEETIIKLMELLDENDDVQNVYTNADI
ncbi:MAG: YebC/PmpR family DNA-binding transcriptional regulator [Candidatus Komeilibacteria bacterium]